MHLCHWVTGMNEDLWTLKWEQKGNTRGEIEWYRTENWGNVNERKESNNFFKWLHRWGVIYFKWVPCNLWLRCISFASQLSLNRSLQLQFCPALSCKWHCWPAPESKIALSGLLPSHLPIINDPLSALSSNTDIAICSSSLRGDGIWGQRKLNGFLKRLRGIQNFYSTY